MVQRLSAEKAGSAGAMATEEEALNHDQVGGCTSTTTVSLGIEYSLKSPALL